MLKVVQTIQSEVQKKYNSELLILSQNLKELKLRFSDELLIKEKEVKQLH